MPDPWSVDAYTASDNALRGRGSGYARLADAHQLSESVYASVGDAYQAPDDRLL